MREHPVVVTRLHPLFQLEQALDVFLRKLNRAVGAVVFRRMEGQGGSFQSRIPATRLQEGEEYSTALGPGSPR
jgi:hypothetical protein